MRCRGTSASTSPAAASIRPLARYPAAMTCRSRRGYGRYRAAARASPAFGGHGRRAWAFACPAVPAQMQRETEGRRPRIEETDVQTGAHDLQHKEPANRSHDERVERSIGAERSDTEDGST